MVGRYQPFHDGHKALIVEALKRVGQVCIAVRDTLGTDDKNPFSFEYVRARIEHGLREYEGRFVVIAVPNISTIFYGRDVGYLIERIELPSAVEEISATRIRTALAGGRQALTPALIRIASTRLLDPECYAAVLAGAAGVLGAVSLTASTQATHRNRKYNARNTGKLADGQLRSTTRPIK
jgi:hypothetical protein